MSMSDMERTIKRLERLIKTAHYENYDFVYIPVGTAKTIVRLLGERRREAGLRSASEQPSGDHVERK